jgi:hypothetical protein
VTTIESGSASATFSNAGTAFTVSSKETLDLNTGKDTWHRILNSSDASGVCPSTTLAIDDWTAQLPIYLSPIAPPTITLSVVNPFAQYVSQNLAPPAVLDAVVAANSPGAAFLAADGNSAVMLVLQSTSPAAVTFSLSATGTNILSGTAVAALSLFDPTYLSNPNAPGSSAQPVAVDGPTYGPDSNGLYTFLALLWGAKQIPVPSVNLAVTAAQQGATSNPPPVSITLVPPPLLLVHGIWSSADAAGFSVGSGGFGDWLRYQAQYPHNLIFAVDYGPESSKAFSDPSTREILLSDMTDALAAAAVQWGMAARSVDVVAHSMGGLVTRYFLSTAGYSASPVLLPSPVHKLITVGTPHQGTLLATALADNQSVTNVSGFLAAIQCTWKNISPCTVGGFFNSIGKTVDTGVQSLEPSSIPLGMLSAQTAYSPIVGLSTVPATFPLQVTEPVLNSIIGGFLPGQSIETILSTNQHDTIVPATSQSGGV